MADCLTAAELECYHLGILDDAQRVHIESHLKSCPQCRSEYEEHLRDVEFLAAGKLALQSAAGMEETEVFAHTPQSHGPAEHLPRIEGYEIIRMIGRGGMAVVYEAIQKRLNRRVALKLLPAVAGSAQPSLVTRFQREASSSAKLHHTNIIPIYDYGESRDGYFYAMELIHGNTLRDLVRRLGAANAPDITAAALAALVQSTDTPQSDDLEHDDAQSESGSVSSAGATTAGRGRVYFRQVAIWMSEAAEGLHYAHVNGIIHRDVKPSNLILSTDGRMMIADFGLAKLVGDESVTLSGSLIGTYRYMSPEQVGAKRVRVDARTDVYSLGATLYELLTLQPAYNSNDREELLGHILFRDALAPRKIVPAVPAELQTICLKSMEKAPEGRYASAKDLADDLRRYVNDLPIVARPPSVVDHMRRFVRRHRAATATAVVIVLAAAFSLWMYDRSSRERNARVEELLKRGATLLTNHELDRAKDVFLEVAALDSGNFRALANLGLVYKDMFYESGDQAHLTSAEQFLRRAREISPDHSVVKDYYGVVLRNAGRLDEAIDIHRAVIAQDAGYYPAWVNLGTALAMAGRVTDSVDPLQKGFDLGLNTKPLGPKFMPAMNLAAVLTQLQADDALPIVESARTTSDSGAESSLLTTKLYLEHSKYFDPVKAIRFAITADTQTASRRLAPLTKRYLALAELRNKHWSAAIEAAQAALASADSAPVVDHLVLAIAHAEMGDKRSALEDYQTAIATWPAEIDDRGFIVGTMPGSPNLLWIESRDALMVYRIQAERLLGIQSGD